MTLYRIKQSVKNRPLPVKKWRKERQWLYDLLHFVGVDGNIVSL